MPLPTQRRPGQLRLRFGWHLVLWLVLAAMVAVGSGTALWWALGSPDMSGGFAARDRFELVKIALAIAAGVGGVVALVVAARRQHISEAENVRQDDAARREDTKLFNERFGKAADLLSSDRSVARLAGIYAMAGLADDWVAGRQTCVDVLCAYLRMPYVPPVPGDDATTTDTDQPAAHEERHVRQTIIHLIASHLRPQARVAWCGRDFDFTGAVFDGGSFDDVVFSGGEVSFRRATFSGNETRFINSAFTGGTVSFLGAEFSGGETAFVGATFGGATVDFSFAKVTGGLVNFIGAKFGSGLINFSQAEFTGGDVAFVGAEFSGTEVWFGGTRFDGANVSFGRELLTDGDSTSFSRGAVFSGGRVSFSNADFVSGRVSFAGADFLGGEVRVHPRSADAPPVFDDWKDGPPAGLEIH